MAAGPEHSYDALVQFGNAPITGIVNMLWKREVLEQCNLSRSENSSVDYENLVEEYTEKRSVQEKTHSVPRNKKQEVKWKRPLCVRTGNPAHKKQKRMPQERTRNPGEGKEGS